MPSYELAQLNIALMVAPLESPEMRDFVDNLDRVNQLAEAAPGFIWRLQTDDGDATAIRPFGQDYLVNVSVWTDVESLRQFVYRSAHVEVMRRRKEWFQKMQDAYTVLWWVEAGHRPTAYEAKMTLQLLRERGATSRAFTFKQPFPSPE